MIAGLRALVRKGEVWAFLSLLVWIAGEFIRIFGGQSDSQA